VAAWSATVDQLWTEAGPTWHGRESARPLIGIIAVSAGTGAPTIASANPSHLNTTGYQFAGSERL
jgi:hypothetical protein